MDSTLLTELQTPGCGARRSGMSSIGSPMTSKCWNTFTLASTTATLIGATWLMSSTVKGRSHDTSLIIRSSLFVNGHSLKSAAPVTKQRGGVLVMRKWLCLEQGTPRDSWGQDMLGKLLARGGGLAS